VLGVDALPGSGASSGDAAGGEALRAYYTIAKLHLTLGVSTGAWLAAISGL